MEQRQAFRAFLEEYAAFFEKMADDEQQKRAALLSDDVQRVDRALAAQQASSMQLEGLERRREELQRQAGFEGKTFREILAQLQGREQEEFLRLFERISSALAEIKFSNARSMEIARANLQVLGSAVPPELLGEQQGYTAQKKQNPSLGQRTIFETKI